MVKIISMKSIIIIFFFLVELVVDYGVQWKHICCSGSINNVRFPHWLSLWSEVFILTIVFRVWGLVHYGLSLWMAQQFWVVYDSITHRQRLKKNHTHTNSHSRASHDSAGLKGEYKKELTRVDLRRCPQTTSPGLNAVVPRT